jgi:protoporphyrinogen oxidase
MAVVDQLYLFRTLLYAIWCADFDDVSKHQNPFGNFTKIERRYKRFKNPGLSVSSPQ